MLPDQPLEGIYRIQVPTPYSVGPVNCYLLEGPEPVLVDCGPGTAEAEAALRRGLTALRLSTRDIAQIVLTHHHPDHAGGLAWLRRETPAPVLAHPDCDRWLLDDPRQVEARQAFSLALYRYCGLAAQHVAGLRNRWADYNFLDAPHVVAHPLDEGVEVDLGNGRWQVLETPGHASTHLGFLRADGAFLGGDTLLERISSNALLEPPPPGQPARIPSLPLYRRTLQRLATLPIEVVLPGHGRAFSGAHPLLQRRLLAQDDRAQRILSHLLDGASTVHALSVRLFPGLAPEQLYLGLSEVLGHLDILEEQGVVRHEGDTPARYTLV